MTKKKGAERPWLGTPYVQGLRAIRDCPIEAGYMHDLADFECPHSNMPTRSHPADPDCGCWLNGRRVPEPVAPKPVPKPFPMPVAPPKPHPIFPPRGARLAPTFRSSLRRAP